MKNLTLLTFSLSILFVSCKKEGTVDYQVTKNYGTADFILTDSKDIIDNLSTEQSARTANICEGVVVLLENEDNFATPDTITVDFGEENIYCLGKQRRGKIIAIRTDTFLNEGSSTTITFDNYYVNNHNIVGEKTITNIGLNSNNQMYWEINVNTSFTFSNGESMSYSAERTRTWTQGMSTLLNKLDDQYEINGSSSGNFNNGGSFNMNITTPITYKFNCWLINSCAKVSGIKEITKANGNTRNIDFGNGDCDCIKTIVGNGESYEVGF